jgi:hypothetical protein
MNTFVKDNPLLSPPGPDRTFGVWMVLVLAVFCFGASLWMGWPLGPRVAEARDDTLMRLALATLLFGQGCSLGIFSLLLADRPRRNETADRSAIEVTQDARRLIEQSPLSAGMVTVSHSSRSDYRLQEPGR